MDLTNDVAFSNILNWLSNGVWSLVWWQIVLITLGLTHITMISVTVYLHRHQAHRSLDLHPLASHFFRLWLWLTTGQVTKEWAAIHRKHHAKCEQIDDPHSPHIHGIKTVLFSGAELYRDESKNLETMARYGHGTPSDWIERNLYTRFSWQGVGVMLIINLCLFGTIGLTVWAIQMAWTPIMAAGIVNGAGHYWGYRNFEATDSSTNLLPWGILIAGEELHNNHHTYPTSAKLSVKPYEFDIGWMYICALEFMGMAKVKKTPPKISFGLVRPLADSITLDALILNRYEIMARYAKEIRKVFKAEVQSLKLESADVGVIKAARRWMHRDVEKVPVAVIVQIDLVRAASPILDKMVIMREELKQMWLSTNISPEQLALDLQEWCYRAEVSGIRALKEFSLKLKSVQA